MRALVFWGLARYLSVPETLQNIQYLRVGGKEYHSASNSGDACVHK